MGKVTLFTDVTAQEGIYPAELSVKQKYEANSNNRCLQKNISNEYVKLQ